jgi:hypothetical protein
MRYYIRFCDAMPAGHANNWWHNVAMKIKDGTLIAIAAASLFASACKKEDQTSRAPASPAAAKDTIKEAVGSAATAPTATEPSKEKVAAMVHCGGINECKGKSLCATDKTSCAGANACKGQGWIDVSADDCTAKGGKVVKGM